MKEFSTYLFKDYTLHANIRKQKRARVFYFGLFIFLMGALLFADEFDVAPYVLMAGGVMMLIGWVLMNRQYADSTPAPMKLRLTPDAVYFGETKMPLMRKEDIVLTIKGFKGQPIPGSDAVYHTHTGTDNRMRVTYGGRVTHVKFVLENEYMLHELIRFCDEHGFAYSVLDS